MYEKNMICFIMIQFIRKTLYILRFNQNSKITFLTCSSHKLGFLSEIVLENGEEVVLVGEYAEYMERWCWRIG